MANERLNELAAAERRQRWLRGVASGAVFAVSAAVLVGTELSSASTGERLATRAIGGAGMLLGAPGVAASLLIESPVERLTTVRSRDPGMIHIQPTVAPTRGGVTFGFACTF